MATILAVDGGNSKADVALVRGDGALLAAVRGPSISHQAVGLQAGMANLRRLVDAAWQQARRETVSPTPPTAALGAYCLAGADYPSDVRLLERAIGEAGVASESVILNDTFAALRAGSRRPWGVALICGQGINGCAVAPDGRRIRFDGIGTYSGDWGGGSALGAAALAAAVRGRDGRGPRTALERAVPAFYGLGSPGALSRALYFERVPGGDRFAALAPLVFEVAGRGDAVARGIVDRLADELVAMASALIRRARLARRDPDVVLAGGVFRAEDPELYARIRAGVAAVAPRATIVRLTAPPVLGAALIGLDRLAPSGMAATGAEARVRSELGSWRPTAASVSGSE